MLELDRRGATQGHARAMQGRVPDRDKSLPAERGPHPPFC